MSRLDRIGKANPAAEVEGCCWPGCDGVRNEASNSPPLCTGHIMDVTAFGARRVREIYDQDIFHVSAPLIEPLAPGVSRAVVYYVQINQHIKIGTSINVMRRLASFYLDEEALLATEPGGADIESQRHREFAKERVYANRELFRPSDRLLAHIEQLKTTAA